MSNYSKITDFAVKDGLASGNPAKIIKGAEIDAEFDAIEVASQTKMNSSAPTFTGTMTGFNITLTGTLEANLIDGGTY